MKSKKTYAIDFYDKFNCIGGSCPYTCCKGWQITIDEKTYSKYLSQKFPQNIIMNILSQQRDDIRCIRKIGTTCPYYTQDGLCRFQRDNMENFMPKVCRQYPRTSISFGEYKEATLELSCIRAAELFVESSGRHDFIECSEDVDENWVIGNNSESFLSFLREDRAKILDYLWNENEFTKAVSEIYRSTYIKNQYISRDNIEKAKQVAISTDKNAQFEFIVPKLSRIEDSYAFYPIWFVNEIIYEKFVHNKMKKNNRFLYDLIKSYEKQFGDLSQTEADAFFVTELEKMMKAQPELKVFFVAYFSYLIQQMYAKAYEDYYILGPILLAMIDVEFMLLFVLTFFKENKRIEPADLAAILANVERAVRHNLSLNDDILYKIRKQFF